MVRSHPARRPFIARTAPKPVTKAKKPKRRKCFAVIASQRYSSYQCPSHGMLGGLSEAVAHAVANQYVVEPEPLS